jgi:hypothetical protein
MVLTASVTELSTLSAWSSVIREKVYSHSASKVLRAFYEL